MPKYDYPFNERIRTLLRIEDLFIKMLENIASSEGSRHHNALLTLLQISDIVDRSDLRSDLLQELARQKNAMEALKGNPAIAAKKLSGIIDDLSQAEETLRTENNKLGQTLRNNEWLMSIKQRTGIPGGVCEFDVPSYHFWLSLTEARRRQDLLAWIQPLMPMYQAIVIILKILRGSGATHKIVALNGQYQEMLAGAKPAQMLRVEMADDMLCYPEVSANKYAINIRFLTLDSVQKTQKYEGDVSFSLTLCNL
ncbi:MAG: cell division protein ZapD [Methylophilaceae bacterium]